MDNRIKSALDAAGTAADYSARATYQRGYDAGVESSARATYRGGYDAGYDAGVASVEARANAAEELAELYRRMGSPSQADLAEVARERDRHAAQTVKLEFRADAAEQMVAELLAALEWYADHEYESESQSDSELSYQADKALEVFAPIAGRWCLASERDAAVARAEAAEAREWALGVQVVAQKERLRLADDVVEMARIALKTIDGTNEILFDALAAYDTVPGDAKETA